MHVLQLLKMGEMGPRRAGIHRHAESRLRRRHHHWDTADVYSNGQSEVVIGKAITQHNIPRESLVILTKCFGEVNEADVTTRIYSSTPPHKNLLGLSRKHILDAVDASVRRLGTYIDVLQIHRLDPNVEAEEIMRALHDVVQSGKVRYIGAGSMFAWQFAELQFTATLHGWTRFVSMQNFYNLAYREEEREMIPLCQKLGVGLIPWSPIARGFLARPHATETETLRGGSDKMLKSVFTEKVASADQEINQRVEKVAKDKGVSMANVAIAWTLAKGCCPIVGMSKVERIAGTISALSVKLTEEEVKFLEEPYAPKKVVGHS
jgi:aryl-alcohol dehydrogenase-like predicted oxidoreductase